MSSDPVNLAIGNLTYSWTDVAIAGPGHAPRFTRSYNSLDTAAGPLGPGWTFGYNAHLLFDTSNPTIPKVTVATESGKRDTYFQNANGSYAPPPGAFATLAKNADGTYTLTRKGQTRLAFDAADAAAPEVRDEAGMRALFTRIGWQDGDRFETAAAQAVERWVRGDWWDDALT